ncbi:anucleate primary sterigmata protein A [Coccidioides immitis RS]|uniref:Anucleate primary sterigmata protein A n=1 Tax=Coccidioides immitis (strain RS) TaxID=246410 RepID=J3K7I5_COCIM|nr:anucleate primary sterigmata protein A [Coccidioides immitis RS]EAS30662.3 anucleate primary sterigmata protein A [Coccidioides immitis RS]
MADSLPMYAAGAVGDNGVDLDDPFISSTPAGNHTQREPHRYSSFDAQLFTLNTSSPAQAKRALEAHLAETERRLEETSNLGTALIEQQRELMDKLKEVEQQHTDGEIGPDLRRKLNDLEREYNEIGRETARVALGPKVRLTGQEDGLATPSLDSRHHASPSVFSSQATNSPSKVTVPSRKQRNQPSSRVHDIEFATEISTSLLAQVRQLQALLAEREEAIKALTLEKSHLELEAEGFTQRLRALDESEQRYKDENWSLETQTHDLLAAAKEASDRESRLTSNLNALTVEKNNIQRELDELKQANGRLVEENMATQKALDSELHILRRNITLGESERNALQQKVDELAGQNQELAKAVAAKLRQHEADSAKDPNPEDNRKASDDLTPENSPPPSPNKPTPRHGLLESETLKSSLHHAHRMIQTLKGTIHREKTEKIELKRMLQDARDELEQRRAEPVRPISSHNRRQKPKGDNFKKPARPEMLGAGRKGITQIEVAEPEWEDEGEPSPTRVARPNKRAVSYGNSGIESSTTSDAYQTANETEAFETANEREVTTESEAFQTGTENFIDESSDDLTETESRTMHTGTIRPRRSGQLNSTRPMSFASTASTSGDEDEYIEVRTPVQHQPPRYRIKMSRGRRGRVSQESHIRQGSVPLSPRDSPASLNSPPQSPRQREISGGQSLFAELSGLAGAGSDSEFGAPLRSSTMSEMSTPSRRQSFATLADSSRPVTAREIVMVDSCTMTEPLPPAVPAQFEIVSPPESTSDYKDAETSTAPREGVDAFTTFERIVVIDSATQCMPIETPLLAKSEPAVTIDIAPEIPDTDANHESLHATIETLPSPVMLPMEPTILDISPIYSEQTAPISPMPIDLQSRRPSVRMDMSVIAFEDSRPSLPAVTPSKSSLDLAMSSIQSTSTNPLAVPVSLPESKRAQVLEFSTIFEVGTSPKEAIFPTVPPMTLEVSNIQCVESLPVKPVPTILSVEPPTDTLKLNGIEAQPCPPQVTDRATQSQISTMDRGISTSPLPKIETESQGSQTALTEVLETGERSSQVQISTAEISSQTILTGFQIDKLLMERQASRPVTAIESSQAQAAIISTQSSPLTTPKAKQLSSAQTGLLHPNNATRRPGSSGSQRLGNSLSVPPLPVDHKQTIAAASQRLSSEASPSVMGPPIAPASSYRSSSQIRPRTPSEQPSRNSARNQSTPQTKFRRTSTSMASRRSSISSFASELDERFNIAKATYPFESGADPRMIQAITQTMIGEFLWKYTRKLGRSDMSNTRHQRYFWVNPYTRTLYWGPHDPQVLAKSQQRSKSVAIEAVRVVNDDNPYPPGLHRKSLEIITPGRTLKFTAATSQRHETWFNALSYLLLRTADDETEEQDVVWEAGSDYNATNGRNSRQAESRRSISSHNSRAARTISKQFVETVPTLRRPVTPNQPSPSPSSRPGSSLRPDQTRPGSVTRISNVFRSSGIKSTFSSRRSRYGNASGSIDSTSAASNDSAEELRRVIERQDREADRLENVRACCDGKHDVSALSRTSRYSARISPLSHHVHS